MRDDAEWMTQLRNRYTRVATLPPGFAMTDEERACIGRLERRRSGGTVARDAAVPARESAGESPAPAFAVTRYYLSLATNTPDDPIRIQFMPSPREEEIAPCELADPLGESRYAPCPRLVHQYRDRALLLTTGTCAVYCRHCFRRSFTRYEEGFITDQELGPVLAYLAAHGEIRQLLLSGGDILTGSDERIGWLLDRLRAAVPAIVFRVCTRVPAVLPARITPGLVRLIAEHGPAWFVVHYNHPRELAPESLAALARIVDAGIPVVSQTVLLKGVNDSVATLADLFNGLVSARVKPYYLFQGDLARGTSHLRVPLDRGLELYAGLRREISPLALPVYAVDLPGGGGKISLADARAIADDGAWRAWRSSLDGGIYRYPLES